jgi:uroporphyrinogen-III decarboxylase
VDTTKAYKAVFWVPGLFEQCHHLGEITNILMDLMLYGDEMHDLIKYITEYELRMAELICKKLQPDCLFHHDDWGSRTSTFMNPDMFEEFFVEPYKEIYHYYKTHGCELIIHHSDIYGATLVPYMKEMGIDVWQGCMSSNNLPELRRNNVGQIAFMGGFDGADYDKPDWDAAEIRGRVFQWLDQFESPAGYVPCIAQGGPGSVYDGVYEAIFDAVDKYNEQRFGVKPEEYTQRLPMQFEKIGYM